MFISQSEVQQWFSKQALISLAGPEKYEAEKIGRGFLLAGGHRWRPWLFAGVYEALTSESSAYIIQIAFAIECFHKASLIHDDIEDDDKPNALHRLIRIPEALNAGDYLIHLAYSLIHTSDPCEIPRNLIGQLASTTQLQLCYGQGEELATGKNDYAILKTVPMFHLAFEAATFCANIYPDHINEFCDSLGEAFQAFDDWKDGKRTSTRSTIADLSSWVDRIKDAPLRTFLRHYVKTMFADTQCQLPPTSPVLATVQAP